MEIKAITLTQPWATLVALGAKRIETRSWSTGYRGPLAIHAAKGLPRMRIGERMTLGRWEVERDSRSGLLLRSELMSWPYRLPIGAMVAVATLTNVLPTDDPDCVPGPDDEALGDYTTGRYGWYLSSVSRIQRPIVARGALGLWSWDLPDDVNRELSYPIRPLVEPTAELRRMLFS